MSHLLFLLLLVHPVAFSADEGEQAVHVGAQFGVMWSAERPPGELLRIWVDPQDHLMGLDAAGHVWARSGRNRWIPLGEGWRRSSALLSNDEDVLLDIESRLEDLTESGDPFEFSEEEDDGEEESFQLSNSDTEAVVAELETGAWFLEQGVGAEELPARAVRMFLVEGRPWVVHVDGVDAWTGLRWDRRFLGQAITGGGEKDGRVLMVADGALWRIDETGRWQQVQSLGGLHVVEVHGWEGHYLLATPDGLWRWDEAEGLTSTEVSAPIEQVVREEGALWIRTEESLIRYRGPDDLEARPLPSSKVGALGVRGGERPVIAGLGGVWLGEQGQWRAVVGAPATQVLSIATTEDRLWVLNDTELLVADLSFDPAEMDGVPMVPLPPLDWLLRAAMHRPEVVVRPGSRSKAIWLPRVELEASFLPGEGLQYEPESGSTGETDTAWAVLSRLTWSPPGRRSNEVHQEAALEERTSDILIRTDGGTPTLMDASALPRAASVVSRTGRSRGTELGKVVVALYRERLGYETLKPPEDVTAEVLSHLDRGAVEALIDVYTEGAYSRWMAGEPQPMGETQ